LWQTNRSEPTNVFRFLSYIIIITNSSTTFPVFSVPDDTTQDFLAKARALAAGEHISLSKYLAGMLRHALCGDNLDNIYFC
jgi:hypothetical protein